MKTIPTIAKRMLMSALVLATAGIYAQGNAENQEQHKYRLYIVKDENGNKEVLDKSFASKEEMDAYIKDNKIEVPESPDVPEAMDAPAPPVPPNPPTPPQSPNVKEKPCNKHSGKSCDKKEKKIIIIEKEEGSANGKTDLNIDYNDFSPNERATIIQDILNKTTKGENVQIIQVRKTEGEDKKVESKNTEKAQPPLAIEDLTADAAGNLSDVKVFPNPSSGSFHVEFKIGKPTDVKLRITDVEGKEVYADALSNYSGKYEKEINKAGLSRGTYLMNIEAGGEKKTTKVVMQ